MQASSVHRQPFTPDRAHRIREGFRGLTPLAERSCRAEACPAGRFAVKNTPLHIAAENGLADVVRALLNRGADPLAVDAEDRTPLARAAAKNRNEIVDLLNERT